MGWGWGFQERRAYTPLLIVGWHRGLRKGVFPWRYHSLHCVYVCAGVCVCLSLSNQIVCRRPYYVMQLCLSAVLHVWRAVEACDCCDGNEGTQGGAIRQPGDFSTEANISFEKMKKTELKI